MFGVLRPSTPERERLPISPGASPPPPRTLAPMPPSEFASREELLAGCKDWAAHQGFAVVIARSRFNRLWLKCDRGGTYENRRNLLPDQRKRKRGESRLLGCKFRMLANVKKDGVWKVETEVPDHNHAPSEDLSAHPTLRRMTDEQVNKVNEMSDAGKSPAETLEELRTLWPDIKVLTRDIYNARKKYKTQKELAEQAAGRPEAPPFEDPNGVFPGPSSSGRWAWLEDGDEVMSKKSKRRRRAVHASAPPPSVQPTNVNNAALDPQLQQSPDAAHTSNHQPVSEANQQLLNDYNQNHPQPARPSNTNPQPRYGNYNSTPSNTTTTYARQPTTAAQFPLSQKRHNEDSTSHPQKAANTTSSRLRSQQRPPHAPMSAPTTTTTAGTSKNHNNNNTHSTHSNNNTPAIDTLIGAGSSKAQNGQVIMSRIERMEKEQRDQKSMLELILGAVTERRG